MRQENMRRLISVASLVIIMLVFGVTSDSFFYCGQYIEYFAGGFRDWHYRNWRYVCYYYGGD